MVVEDDDEESAVDVVEAPEGEPSVDEVAEEPVEAPVVVVLPELAPPGAEVVVVGRA